MPSVRATIVGPRPAAPTTALRTRSGLEVRISSRIPCSPARTCPPHAAVARSAASGLASATAGTPCSRACSSSGSQFDSAERAATCRPSLPEITSRACVPIDPVDPSISTRFTATQCRCPSKPSVKHLLRLNMNRVAPQLRLRGALTQTAGPWASRPRASWLDPALADLDRRELELRHLQVADGLVAGDREGVLPALRSGDDVDAEP